MPRVIQLSSRIGHLVLSAIAIIAVTVTYIAKGAIPAEVLIGILASNGIGGVSSALVSAADKVAIVPAQRQPESTVSSGV